VFVRGVTQTKHMTESGFIKRCQGCGYAPAVMAQNGEHQKEKKKLLLLQLKISGKRKNRATPLEASYQALFEILLYSR
jgi:hypothetical protein